MSKNTENENSRISGWCWLMFPGVVGLWWLSAFVVYKQLGFEKWAERGVFGDSFGAINSLFSGLAFAGVIFTILLQRKELQLQRKELEEARKEYAGQRKQLEVQSVVMEQQRFENTFFGLLKTLNDILKGTVLPEQIGVTFEGADAHQAILASIDSQYSRYDPKRRKEWGPVETYRRAFLEIYKKNGEKFIHYMNLLQQIVEFVDKSSMSNKMFYTNIVKAQLTHHQVGLLFHFGLSEHGESFKKLIEQYGLLKHLSVAKPREPELVDQYRDIAYKVGR